MTAEVAARRRAGSPLTEDQSKRVNIFFMDDRKGRTQHGTVDLVGRFYQIGGQFSDFHFRKRDLITMPFQVWTQLERYRDYLQYLEWYDREQDVAYLCTYADAVQHGVSYSAGIGVRWGVPFNCFGRDDLRG